MLDFHELVKSGSLEQLQQALARGADVNAPGHVEQTPLMTAIAVQDLEKMRLLIDRGADPELTDQFNGTALGHAVNWDFAEGVRYLLSLGVDRGHAPKYPLKQIDYDSLQAALPEAAMPEELKQCLSEEEWRESMEKTNELIRQSGLHPKVEPMISDVLSVEVLNMFLGAGDDLELAPTEVKRELIGIGNRGLDEGGEFQTSKRDFKKHHKPRFGKRNPERMDNPFWGDMIRLGGHAFSAREHFHRSNPMQVAGPVWCFDRFGTSLTPLGDGRFVQIGGEHEDFYDPDFQIYNDVVIHDGEGGFHIYGYPEHIFPPTDNHTATRVGAWIYIVGCLGYSAQRRTGETPVYRLELDSWRIEAVPTTGEMPGWIHCHAASYEGERNVIRVTGGDVQMMDHEGNSAIVPNPETFELDLTTFCWSRVAPFRHRPSV